jgi:hypothetical protein
MRGVLSRESGLNRSGDQATHFVSEIFDFRERCLSRRALRTKAAGCERSDAFLELFLRLFRESNRLLSVLAHASFLSK